MWVLTRAGTCAAFAAGLIAFGAARAVPPGSASFTAAATCEFRALAAQHHDRRLRNGDTLAGQLCPPTLLPREYEAARDVIDVDPESYAGYFYVNARTRYIDARLTKAIAEGAVQVVVLGAGFDSRAYRFHRAHPKIAFFEVDLPATIDAKRRALGRALGAVPGYVRYVPFDFDTQTLQSALAGAGYEPAARSFFILEGVTMYVSEGASAPRSISSVEMPRPAAAWFTTISCGALLKATTMTCTRRASRRSASLAWASPSLPDGRPKKRPRSHSSTALPCARNSTLRP